jgi:ribosomal subunit interface protein
MRINIHTVNVELTDYLKNKIEKRMQYLFRNLDRDVQSAKLYLHNERVGLSKFITHCKIQIQTRGLPVIYAEHKSPDMYVSFDAAAHRAHKYTSRRLTKFNRLLTQLKNLNTKKIRAKTLRINKSHKDIIGSMV